MKFSATPRWSSFAQASKNLDELVGKVERQAKREATRKASLPMLKAARAKAPQDKVANPGDLKKSLIVKVSTSKDKKLVIARIGINRKAVGLDRKGGVSRPRNYGHLEEFGSVHNAARPYMRPAFDETKDQCTKVYAGEIGPAIQRVAKRINKKYPL